MAKPGTVSEQLAHAITVSLQETSAGLAQGRVARHERVAINDHDKKLVTSHKPATLPPLGHEARVVRPFTKDITKPVG